MPRTAAPVLSSRLHDERLLSRGTATPGCAFRSQHLCPRNLLFRFCSGGLYRGPQRTPVARVLGWRRISLARNIKTVSFRGAQHASSHRGYTMSACYHVAQPLLAVHSDRSILAPGICFSVFVAAAFTGVPIPPRYRPCSAAGEAPFVALSRR